MGMLSRWQNSSSSRTSIGSPGLFPSPGSGASLVIPWRWSSPSSAAEKNGLRRLRASVSDLLRQAAPACPGSLLWRQACLPRLSPAQGPVLAVRGREERTLGLARRQPAVHQALRLLRGPALSRNPRQGGGRGTLPRLAHRQGAGQAVHARAAPPGGHSTANALQLRYYKGVGPSGCL